MNHKKTPSPCEAGVLVDAGATNYFVRPICTGSPVGAASISWNFGSGRRRGAFESLVQQPHEVERTVTILAKVKTNRRIITDVGLA
jgi:hypothetical protein